MCVARTALAPVGGAQVLNEEHVSCLQMGQVIKPKSMHAHSRSPRLLACAGARPDSDECLCSSACVREQLAVTGHMQAPILTARPCVHDRDVCL